MCLGKLELFFSWLDKLFLLASREALNDLRKKLEFLRVQVLKTSESSWPSVSIFSFSLFTLLFMWENKKIRVGERI